MNNIRDIYTQAELVHSLVMHYIMKERIGNDR